MWTRQVGALLVLGFAPILSAGPVADDFYRSRLAAGKAEVQAGQYFDAIDDFRIACFGFLDQPALLQEGLARLALAQDASGRTEDVTQTLRRLVEVETRFKTWPTVDLEPETRSAITALAAKRLGAAGSALVAPPEGRTPGATASPTSRTGSPAPAASAPSPATSAEVFPLATPPPSEAVLGPPAPGSPAPAPGEAAATTSRRSTADVLAESRSLVTQGRYVENLRKLVAAVAGAPSDRELRKALLEAAVLTKDWKTAAAQIEEIEPFRDGEDAWMFYGAVALFETGAVAQAKPLISKCLPRLARSPYVDYYGRRIQSAPER